MYKDHIRHLLKRGKRGIPLMKRGIPLFSAMPLKFTIIPLFLFGHVPKRGNFALNTAIKSQFLSL